MLQTLISTINDEDKNIINVESFVKLVKKYTNIEKLDCEILRTFVDEIFVCQAKRID